jgi:hypothetical protein
MPETGPDHRPDSHINGQFIQEFNRQSLLFKEPHEDQITEEKSGSEQQSVPPNSEIANPEDLGIHIPVDCTKNHGLFVYICKTLKISKVE